MSTSTRVQTYPYCAKFGTAYVNDKRTKSAYTGIMKLFFIFFIFIFYSLINVGYTDKVCVYLQ